MLQTQFLDNIVANSVFLVIEELNDMEHSIEDSNNIYCSHCDDWVSRSTYSRHQKKRKMPSKAVVCTASSSSDSSSNEEGKVLFF